MIVSKENSEHYIWGSQCDSWVLRDTGNLSVKQEKMPPNTSEKLHFHDHAEQFFYILKGQAVFCVEDKKIILKKGEGISVLPKSKHCISNESAEDVEFLVISNPSTNNDRVEV
ncbi:mannose-6-phosphate isomerase-like protein (cupin superfamily) [Chryseobacterium defluvii]|uniref:Mannose-6-phosphate isomerase-like protein (Cupin superfamily) n=1 Tax=Chryseobacterium defluvii TaxID=160396 RepID=A0A840KI51_9FLAO|nr:cupin domain-containing protein [Chryseobacterium defluvii]MBB4807617.1 mannose-6-phosphate isomerase-like protein (cupin superfamily) [Chryseobacterium defluvii]